MTIREIILSKGRKLETTNGFESLRAAALKMRMKDVDVLIVTERAMIRGLITDAKSFAPSLLLVPRPEPSRSAR